MYFEIPKVRNKSNSPDSGIKTFKMPKNAQDIMENLSSEMKDVFLKYRHVE